MKITYILLLFILSSVARAADHLQTITKNETASFISDLETFVNTDSGSNDLPDLKKMQQLIEQKLKSIGMSVTTIKADNSPANIIFGALKGTGTKNIMLLAHYDTVYPSGEAEKKPFKTKDNYAYGPGVADTKAGVLLALYTAKIVKDLAINNYAKLTLAFNPDEENGSPGSHQILTEIARKQDYILNYEPPAGTSVTVGTRGSAKLELTIKGRSAHAGMHPKKGLNAALELVNQIQHLQNLGNDAKGTGVNWTIMNSGTRLNVIPEDAKAMADVRVYDTDEFIRVANDASKIISQIKKPGITVNSKLTPLMFPLPRNSNTDCMADLAEKIYRENGLTLDRTVVHGGTDTGFFYDHKNQKPAILDGMGIIGGSLHSPTEWANLNSIQPRLYLSVKLIGTLLSEQLCQ